MNSVAKRSASLRRSIIRWFRRHGRDLPWRRTRDPYAILVSEVMLQQTQVERVIPKYRAFLRRFPSLGALARATLRDVLQEWSGLGYNGRAKRLWDCAQRVVVDHGGRFPREVDALRGLPGIGPYTAGALASFAFGAHAACVDTNIRRVLSRAIAGRTDIEPHRAWRLANRALPSGASAEWNQAAMDVGAIFCRAQPRCHDCPARQACRFVNGSAARNARAQRAGSERRAAAAPFHGSPRYYRGRVLKILTSNDAIGLRTLGEQVKDGFAKTDLPWLTDLLEGLERDGLVTLDRRRRTASLP